VREKYQPISRGGRYEKGREKRENVKDGKCEEKEEGEKINGK
jgi:hypothetical protein